MDNFIKGSSALFAAAAVIIYAACWQWTLCIIALLVGLWLLAQLVCGIGWLISYAQQRYKYWKLVRMLKSCEVKMKGAKREAELKEALGQRDEHYQTATRLTKTNIELYDKVAILEARLSECTRIMALQDTYVAKLQAELRAKKKGKRK